LVRNPSNIICFCLFLKNFLICCITLLLNRLLLLFTTAILGGGHFSTRRDDCVILCSTFEFLFEFQNRIFLEFCSSFKLFEHQTFRNSRVHCILKIYSHALLFQYCLSTAVLVHLVFH
jgi:hypothetical protein